LSEWVPTLIIVIGTAALGTWLLRQQGLSTLARARSRLDSGELPATQLIEGAILLVGGALLLTPGFMTDAVGFACLVPPSRRWLAAQLASRFQVVAMHGAASGESQTGGFPGRGQSGPVPRPRAPGVKSALKPGSFLAGSANGHNNLVGYGSRVLKFRARSLELALEEREC